MKPKFLFIPLLILAVIAISSPAGAQTRQFKLVADFRPMYFECLDRTIAGTWTAHFTYFLDKDGKIARLHINTWKSDLNDVNTGEEVKCIDIINDSWGYYFWFLNNPNAGNGIPPDEPNMFNVEDGWLDEYMPEVYPFEEGTMVEMNWKYMIKGEKFGISTLIQLHVNAHGELTADVLKEKVICTE